MHAPYQLINRFNRLQHAATVALGVFALHGCASLPEAGSANQTAIAKPIQFETSQGAVSEKRSDAILARLDATTGATDVLQKHLAHEQAINADSPLVLGNKLTLLQNGPATYRAMFAAIRAAKDHINLETYIFDDDEIGRQFSDLLLERQAAGVQVNIIHDSVGALLTPTAFFDRLRDGGVDILEFNPVIPFTGNKKSWLLNNRDHRKQLVIDGRIVFTGGINISGTYSSSPGGKRANKRRANQPIGWRDTHLQIEGPVVAEFQKLFMETWTRQKGTPLKPRNYFPTLAPQGDEIVRAIGSTPSNSQDLIYLTLLSVITHAEKHAHLTIAYFAPDPQLLKALTDAAQRGVEVKLVLPSYTDSWSIFHLGRSYYTTLLKGGVKLYLRRGAVMHAKTASVDGVWSTVGSTNLDWRSFLHNDEINAVVISRQFAAQMDTMFNADIAESDEITLDAWQRRSLLAKLKERFARLGAYWL
jgi:cardiolipin synthase